MAILRLILGDQLSHEISALQSASKTDDIILLCEVMEEVTYVKHHKKKVAFLFSAMRHFAAEITHQGYHIRYTQLDDPDNAGSLTGEVKRALAAHAIDQIIVTFPGEFRVLEMMQSWQDQLACPVEIRPDHRFIAQPEDFAKWAAGRKVLRMKYFYRDMRKQHQVLMDGDQPVGGEWSYDQDNRKPPKSEMDIPVPLHFEPDTTTKAVISLVEQHYSGHFGDLDPFYFAVTQQQAAEVLSHFVQHRLPRFGDYQDAMLVDEPWMYHSHISFYLNCGLLLPEDCIRQAEQACLDGLAPLNAVEGFIRQILGWREYVRGLYWHQMPGYTTMNHLKATRRLPGFFWTGKTDMRCLQQSITQTKQFAYAHHIQRLMVLGNFLLLAGVAPSEVNEWYLIVYADAYEWVELPNVTGMILFADGGVLASKPYAASGRYIDKMSNYCQGCRYNVKEKTGDKACPFNYLYWDFLIRHQDKLSHNQRMRMIYSTLSKMKPETVQAMQVSAKTFLDALS